MITIFGASVTQQKTGFAYKLKEKIEQPVLVFGYGGMHLNNAAICYLDKVIATKPRYCFIDWFSTGYNSTDQKTEKYIDTIIFKLQRIKCNPIFLFLPFKENDQKAIFHCFCKEILKKRNATYIDIVGQTNNEPIERILKDSVHTTDYGSNLYCDIIADYFLNNTNLIKKITVINNTEFTDIRELEINKIFKNIIRLNGECEIIGFLLTIGPHSGLIKINNNYENYIENTWDRWCHYNRKHFNLAMSLSGNAELNILQDSFDTSECTKRNDFYTIRKKIILHSIFYHCCPTV